MDKLFLKDNDYAGLLKELAREGIVYASVEEEGEKPHIRLITDDYDGQLKPASIRAVEPLKALLFPALENVGAYMGGADPGEAKQRAFIIGAKSCDLRSLEILDRVFAGGDFEDPFYIEKRDRLTIISSDCTACADECFCGLMDIRPYPTGEYDMNLSKVDGGFVVDTGSERGAEIVSKHKEFFSGAADGQVEERERNREAISLALEEQAEGLRIDADLRKITSEGFEDDVWEEEAGRCVECGACNFICPTCHCFILSDHAGGKGYERMKRWDACQYAGFTRVAGGASVLQRRSERLRNRYDKKFIFFPALMDRYACTGCGRCVSACPGKIDIREILKVLSSQALARRQR